LAECEKARKELEDANEHLVQEVEALMEEKDQKHKQITDLEVELKKSLYSSMVGNSSNTQGENLSDSGSATQSSSKAPPYHD